MTTGDENDILHSIEAQAKSPSEREPGVDMLDHPITEIAERGRVLTLGWHRKRQQSTSTAVA
jgi:hypothetical protein